MTQFDKLEHIQEQISVSQQQIETNKETINTLKTSIKEIPKYKIGKSIYRYGDIHIQEPFNKDFLKKTHSAIQQLAEKEIVLLQNDIAAEEARIHNLKLKYG